MEWRIGYAYAIPVAWIAIGLTYARTVSEGFAAIGIAIMTLISGISILGGVISWHLTDKWYWGLLGMILTFILVFGLIVISVRI